MQAYIDDEARKVAKSLATSSEVVELYRNQGKLAQLGHLEAAIKEPK